MCRTEQLTRAEYVALSPEERKKAREDGRVNQLMGKPVPTAAPTTPLVTRAEYVALTPDQRRDARRRGLCDWLMGKAVDE